MPLDSGGGSGTTCKSYNPDDSQLTAFTRLCYQEQGSDTGSKAEMSLILNKFELAGKSGDATALYNWVHGNGWWANSAAVMDGTMGNTRNPSDAQKQNIKSVMLGGRTLPLYIDEHDYRGDIAYIEGGNGSDIKDNSCYVQHQTKIHNTLGSTYWFYCFPTPESDPFGYTSQDNRQRLGDSIPAGGETVGTGAQVTDSSPLSGASSGGIAGQTFTTGPTERETARVEEGSNPDLKTFYRVNMSGAQFIKQVLAPYCRSAKTGQGAYRLWFSDETNPDGSSGSKLYFKPDQYTKTDDSVSDNILEGIEKEYEFSFGTGIDSSVLDFNPDYTGLVISLTGGFEVDATMTDALTNEIIHTVYGKHSDEKRPSTGDSTYDGLQGRYFVGDSSSSIETLETKAANLWYNMASYGYRADMTIIGDPLIKPQTMCSIAVYTPLGIPHHSSGVYLIYQAVDSIEGGTFTTELSLVRNAMKISPDDSGGVDITVGQDTNFVGEAANLAGANPSSGSGGLTGGTNVTPVAANQVIQSAVDWAIGIANDNTHGYSQANRWGPDYDCSSLVISAYDQAGTGVKSAGANSTFDMRSPFLQCGFVEHNDLCRDCTNAQVGDVYLNESKHVEMYVGNGQNVGAHSNKDGVGGDSGGKEINVQSWWDDNWNVVLRYGA